MKNLLITFIVLVSQIAISQSEVSGRVIEKDGTPLIGVNVYIKGTYDGAFSNENGGFTFTTEKTGNVTLICSYLGYKTTSVEQDVTTIKELVIKMVEERNTLDAVTITANTITTGKNVKYAALTPLDIVTTAGADGDVIAALRTLPGTQQDDNDGRLFVKGGDADETAIYIDGLRVFTPYSRSFQGTPSRGRYSPMIFKGVNFSSSAYASEYGDALSGVLDMKTKDLPLETTTDISLMSLGAQLGRTQKWGNQSIAFNASYINLWFYNKVLTPSEHVIKPYNGLSGEATYRYKLKKGMYKAYVSGEQGSFKVNHRDIESDSYQRISISNKNIYANSSLIYELNSKNHLFVGGSIGRNVDNTEIDSFNLKRYLDGIYLKGKVASQLSDNLMTTYGIDFYHTNAQLQKGNNLHVFNLETVEQTTSIFGNIKYFLTNDLVVQGGFRTAYYSRTGEALFMPNIILAQKTGKSSQVTLSYGQYSQEQQTEYHLYSPEEDLSTRRAQHLSANYNYKKGGNSLRAELFYKKYDRLIRYTNSRGLPSNLSTDGDGDAYGAELFWRNQKLIKNLDFYLSYSLVMGKRKYKDYPIYANPSHNATHTLSLVGKYWVEDWKSLISATAAVSSGRYYENPNTAGFYNEQSPFYKNFSVSWAYLISPQKILYASVSNVPGFKNEYGYRYASTPDIDGIYPGEKITANNTRFYFVGLFITLSDDKKKNQLNNL